MSINQAQLAYFAEEVNPRLVKRPLITNGRLANRGLTSSLKEAPCVCVIYLCNSIHRQPMSTRHHRSSCNYPPCSHSSVCSCECWNHCIHSRLKAEGTYSLTTRSREISEPRDEYRVVWLLCKFDKRLDSNAVGSPNQPLRDTIILVHPILWLRLLDQQLIRAKVKESINASYY